MARPESIAIGGYFPTPIELIPGLARCVALPVFERWGPGVSFFDPCAADGEAIDRLARAVFGPAADSTRREHLSVFAGELEATRFELLKSRFGSFASTACVAGGRGKVLHGDALCATFDADSGVSVALLNPPYNDQVKPRLEERFLRRFASAIVTGGVLLLLVPWKALAASADTLAAEFEDLRCFRPEEDRFGQVLLAAKKRPGLFAPDERVKAQVLSWGSDPGTIAPWSAIWHTAPIEVPVSAGLRDWAIAPFDVCALAAAARPWYAPAKGSGALAPIGEVLADVSLARRYPVAMPLKAAYIAAAAACGVFDGARIAPNDPASGLPDVLVKGVFERYLQPVGDLEDKEGVKVGEKVVEQPRLVLTALDLRAGTFHTLPATDARSGSRELVDFTAADLLDAYSDGMLRVMRENCPVLHDPVRDGDDVVLPTDTARPLYPAQAVVARAGVKLLSPRYREARLAWWPEGGGRPINPLMLGEVGVGKCLGIGTLVLRYDGQRVPVEDVRAGDLLMGPDSSPRRVLGTTRGRGPLYEVRPVVGEPWVCNDAHILTIVHTTSGDVFDVPAREYAENRRLRLCVTGSGRTTHATKDFKQFFPERGVDFPPRQIPTLDPYFLGVWYGDGTKALTGVQVTKPDPEIRDLMHQMARSYGLTVREDVNSSGCPTFALTNGMRGGIVNPILDRLRAEVGDGERLPESCLLGSRETRCAFLAGLLDTDGYLVHNTFEIVQKRRGWADGICFVAHSLGIRATIREKIVDGETYWRVILSGDFMGLPLRIPRKKPTPRVLTRGQAKLDPTALRNHRRVARTGITLVPIGDGEFAGFELDGDGRFLLGDFTVTHNSSIAAVIAVAVMREMLPARRRALVLCPPHLTDDHGWIAQWRACFPQVHVAVHRAPADVDAFASRPGAEVAVGIMSREAAKLGHGFVAVERCCPRCGAPLPTGRDLAGERAVCEATVRRPRRKDGVSCPVATLALRLAALLHPVAPDAPVVEQANALRPRRHAARLGAAYKRALDLPPTDPRYRSRAQRWAAVASDVRVRAIVLATADLYCADPSPPVLDVVAFLLAAVGDDGLSLVVIDQLAAAAHALDEVYSRNSRCATLRRLAFLLAPGSVAQADALDALFTVKERWGYEFSAADAAAVALELSSPTGAEKQVGELKFDSRCGTLQVDSVAVGDVRHAVRALEVLAKVGQWVTDPPCGERLYQANPASLATPKVALASYVARRHPRLYGVLIRDESHEFSNDDSAQTMAAGRLSQLGMPVLSLTGSACGGYAESLFASQWATDASFRVRYPAVAERARGARPTYSTGPSRAEFTRTYGYRKGVVQDRDEEGKVVAFGSQSDRVIRSAKMTGNAPGVLPKFLLDFLLRGAITIHKEELALSLPKHSEELEVLPLAGELGSNFEALAAALRREIQASKFVEGKSGKLWGALAELASYPDVAVEGVGGEDYYEIRYPPKADDGGRGVPQRGRSKAAKLREAGPGDLVVMVKLFPAKTVLPKERWMLDEVERLLKAGRRPLIFARHTALVPRLAQLVRKELGVKVAELPNSGPGAGTGQRQVWIHEHVVAPKVPVMVVNPTKVQTGINALVHFSDAVWMENPGCNAVVWRQANGRIDRIGKTLPTRAVMPVYAGMQEKSQALLHHKVGVSLATDGLDPRSALAMAGIGANGAFDAMSVAQQLYKAMGWDA